jgi:predicted nuclease of restriction endonuclease-like RecB superfamily
MAKYDRRLIKSKKITIDGIEFASRLEGTMYKLLRDNNINFKYESESYTLSDSFLFNNNYHARLASGKGEYCNRGFKKVNAITYKPDFVIRHNDYYAIVETKGLPTESYNMRMKMFKALLNRQNIQCDIYVPQTNAECLETINLILKKI